MSHDRSLAARRAEIDDRLETALESLDRECRVLARGATTERADRWYGQLSALSYESTTATPDTETSLAAATAIELLRGYCRLRVELLARADDGIARSSSRDPTPSLLAGDFLYTSAYSTLGEIGDDSLEACFQAFTTVSETLVEALGTAAAESTPSASDRCVYIDRTAGVLGEGAAVVGSILAGADESRRAHFASIGRGFATGRQIRRTLDPDIEAGYDVPSGSDERRLRQYAQQRLGTATRALRTLSPTVDAASLRAFAERSVTPDLGSFER